MWTNIQVNLPAENGRYLVTDGIEVDIGWYSVRHGRFFDGDGVVVFTPIRVTHWMELPRVDAQPIVRCEKCRWYNSAFYACDKHGICKPVDWFCADGEKEE